MYSLGAEIREKAEREGENRKRRLNEILVRLNRFMDIVKAVQDVIYRQKLYQEFGLQKDKIKRQPNPNGCLLRRRYFLLWG
ncbi:hypothetical protein [Eubacterium sp.]|uniref:hypothetical protein n=1 Tax=Eubacterium sp. TaxID=142586 RepID=UPI003AB1F99C